MLNADELAKRIPGAVIEDFRPFSNRRMEKFTIALGRGVNITRQNHAWYFHIPYRGEPIVCSDIGLSWLTDGELGVVRPNHDTR